MKKHILLLSFFFSVVALSAQTTTPRIFCGNEIFDHLVSSQYPALHDAIHATFDATQAQAREHVVKERTGPATINVVVHVVWKELAENLDDSIILNQIAVLNRDFNRENADTVDLRDVFLPAAGNPQIKFNLVAIERVQTSAEFEISLDGSNLLSNLKKSAEGGSDAWDTEKYLNIWVCHIQPITFGGTVVGQILGFAFPPAGLTNWPANSNAPSPEEDGVVIDFRVFGANNPNVVENPSGGGPLEVRGRTSVHEVGHYLGLRHIWGDGGFFGLPNDCEQSDGIEDTPFANSESAFECDKTRNTCSQIETFYNIDAPDMVENYMDYSSETCQNTFTQGQADHMNSTLAGPRAGLISGASAVTTPTAPDAWVLTPNPASEMVYLSQREVAAPVPVSVRVADATGRLVARLTAENRQVGLPVGQWDNGLYFIHVSAGSDQQTLKLVVQH
jgi:hypothetical protein